MLADHNGENFRDEGCVRCGGRIAFIKEGQGLMSVTYDGFVYNHEKGFKHLRLSLFDAQNQGETLLWMFAWKSLEVWTYSKEMIHFSQSVERGKVDFFFSFVDSWRLF